MSQSVNDLVDTVSKSVCGVTHNFNRAVQLSGRLNVDEIELMDMNVAALVQHLTEIENAIKEARQAAQQIAEVVNSFQTAS